MDTFYRAIRPPFRLAKFEGDAAFVYAVTEKLDGSRLQDSIETAYFAFRKRVRNIKQATSCECRACSEMQHLDLCAETNQSDVKLKSPLKIHGTLFSRLGVYKVSCGDAGPYREG